eukprot:2992560-Karenia_brevis.AAC.1
MKVAHDACNIYDLISDYNGVLTQQLQHQGQKTFKLNLGKKRGDLLTVPFAALDVPVDIPPN